MPRSYDPLLVLLSALIALWAAFDAIRLGGRLAMADRRARPVWVIARALALGIGIWSMHFVAMLALRVPVPVKYQVSLVMLSMVVAIGGSAAGFAIVARESGPRRSLGGAACMGIAISGMHFTAMAGMLVPAEMHFDPRFVTLAIGISIAGTP